MDTNNNTTNRNRPELLAPAGSHEAFYAAVDAGADAVYLGLGSFNARMRAKNFTIHDLGFGVLAHARANKVKVYVAVNTLVKQSEVQQALNVLYQLDQLGVDAVIIADIGLMRLANTHFPNLRIHASTQAAVHNSSGARFLKSLGAKRAVLARELSVDEIKDTARKSPIETEMFVHGALCYSISGQCLASSFIGGESGNRGKCTQVCRRRFKYVADNGRVRDGYFFSPYDLQAIFVIDSLLDSGVSSFKIEGRMKGAEYVGTVVRAYRRAIDNPYETASAARDLRLDFGRSKTSFFLDGRKGNRPIDPSRPSGTGIYAGKIISRGNSHFTLPAQQSKGFGKDGVVDSDAYGVAIEKGDRLRVHPQTGFEGAACTVANCETSGKNIKITLTSAIDCKVGDDVFIIGKAGASSNKNWRVEGAPPKNFTSYYLDAEYIVKRMTPREDEIAVYSKPKLWFKTDTTGWLNYINATPCKHLIFDADMSEIRHLLDLLQKNQYAIDMWRTRMTIALPPFIPEAKLDFWRGIVEKFTSMGLQSFTISNIGHFALVNNGQQITADSAISCLNRFTQVELAARNVKQFVYSYEDDFLNIRNTVPPVTYKKMRQKSTYPKEIVGIVPIYGRPPLFISRMEPAVDDNTIVTDPDGNEFFVAAKNGLYYTLPQTPVCLFAKLDRLSECGIADFLIDLSFHEPDYETLYKLMTLYKNGTKVEEASIFNFKAGLH